MRNFGMYKTKWYCRWCGKVYRPINKETERDGFCCTKHKQAHYRALKKYNATLLPKKRSKKIASGSRKTSNAKQRNLFKDIKPKKPVRVKFSTGKRGMIKA